MKKLLLLIFSVLFIISCSSLPEKPEPTDGIELGEKVEVPEQWNIE